MGQDRVGRNCVVVVGQTSNQGEEDTEQSIEKTWEQSVTESHTGSGCQIYSNEEIRATG